MQSKKRKHASSDARSSFLGRLLIVLAAFSLIAAACSGETSSGDDGDDNATTEAPSDDGGDDDGGDDDGDGEGGDDDGGDDSTATTAAPADDGGDDGGGDDGGGEAAAYDDPRGGIFSDFQAGFDRSHPFQSLDAFCLPHDEAADRVETDPGITADAIEIHHIRQQLENLIDIGFGVEVGDVTAMFEAFVAEINDNCGGIRGRQLDLGLSEFDPLSPDVEAVRNANCIEATEDRNAVMVMNSSGFAGSAALCIAEEHETMFLTTTGLSEDFLSRGGGRLISLNVSNDDSLRFMVNQFHEQGLLEGKVIGIVQADTPGQPEAVQAGLVETLEGLGYEIAVNETIGCGGGTSCTIGVPEAVGALLDANVDVVMPTLNILSLPGLVLEMTVQGFQPGDVQFVNSNFNSQAGDLVSSKVATFGGEASGDLYNGTLIFDAAATGNYKLEGAEIPRFNELCIETYAGQGGPTFDYFSDTANTPQGMLATVCTQMRMVARAIYDAGDNPTRADIYAAMANLGPIDNNNMRPASIQPDKPTSEDAMQTMTWTFPCPDGFGSYDENNTCVVPNDDWVTIR